MYTDKLMELVKIPAKLTEEHERLMESCRSRNLVDPTISNLAESFDALKRLGEINDELRIVTDEIVKEHKICFDRYRSEREAFDARIEDYKVKKQSGVNRDILETIVVELDKEVDRLTLIAKQFDSIFEIAQPTK